MMLLRVALCRAAVAVTFGLATINLAGCGADAPVGPAPVASVDVAPVPGDVWAGTVRQLQATPRASDGSPLVGRAVTWSSNDTRVAEIDASGRLTALAAGAATITATSEGKTGHVTVTVAEADLLYEGYASGLPEMYVLPLRGGEPTRVLPPHTEILDPEPSPDGSRIAFIVANYVDGTGDVYVVNRDGTGLRQLTVDSELDDQPAWSPDGSKIAFRSYRTRRQGDIWVMNADGSNPVLLTPDPLPATTDESRPTWSPDGSRIAYASTAGGGIDLWTMRADGSDKRRLTSSTDPETEPTWSPDGQRIAFRRSTSPSTSDIMVVDAAGGAPVSITGPGRAFAPSWSPDGRFIAFASTPDGGGNPQIYTIRPDGTERTLRTSDYSWAGGRNPSWLRRR